MMMMMKKKLLCLNLPRRRVPKQELLVLEALLVKKAKSASNSEKHTF